MRSRLNTAPARSLRPSLLALLLAATFVLPARPASLNALGAAARVGSYGLRVAVGSSCTAQQELDLSNQSISGPTTHEACREIYASTTTVSGTSPVIFRAGQVVSLGDGFSVTGSDFTTEIEPALQPDAFLVDRSPSSNRHYAAGFFVKPDNLLFGASEELDLLEGLSNSGTKWFRFALKWNASLSEYRLVLAARTDSGSELTTGQFAEVVLPTGWTWVSIDWKAAAPGAFDGHLRLYVNGVYLGALTLLDNDQGLIDQVRFGAVGVDAGTSGSFDVDEFVSRKAGPVAPPP